MNSNLYKLSLLMSVFNLSKDWYNREIHRYSLHPVILKLLEKHAPADLRLLALEYPHSSLLTQGNVAYTRSEKDGQIDRQQSTSFSRYIRRHFPTLKDHEIRDYATLCTSINVEIWDTTEKFIQAAIHGPRSCMTCSCEVHPYTVYSPAFGWRMAVRLSDDKQIDGRALLNDKVFVRSYKRGSDYSYTDEALEFWLTENGYTKEDQWPEGTRLSKLEHNGGIVAPYLDGDCQTAEDCGTYLSINSCGEYDCTSTSGYAENASPRDYYCEHCNEYYTEEQVSSTHDGYLCETCIDDYYVHGYLRGHGLTYVLHCEAVYCESDGEYYHEDSLDYYEVFRCEYNDEFYLRQDLLYCASNECYYHEDYVRDNSEFATDRKGDLYFTTDLIKFNGEYYIADDLPVETEEAINESTSN